MIIIKLIVLFEVSLFQLNIRSVVIITNIFLAYYISISCFHNRCLHDIAYTSLCHKTNVRNMWKIISNKVNEKLETYLFKMNEFSQIVLEKGSSFQ